MDDFKTSRARGSIHGHINWKGGKHSDLIYARYVNGVERVAESIELDGVLFVPFRECGDSENVCACRVPNNAHNA